MSDFGSTNQSIKERKLLNHCSLFLYWNPSSATEGDYGKVKGYKIYLAKNLEDGDLLSLLSNNRIYAQTKLELIDELYS